MQRLAVTSPAARRFYGEPRLVPWLLLPVVVSWAPCWAEEMVVRAAKVYTMAGPALQPGAVLVRDGKIVRTAAAIEAPAGAQVVDLERGVLIPGLVDAHSTMNAVADRSEVTREVTPDFRVVTAIDWEARGFREALAEGITCVHITPGGDNVLAGVSSAVKTAGERGQRVAGAEIGLVMNVSSDPTARNRSRTRPDSIYVRQPTNRMGVVWILRSTLQAARKSLTPAAAAAPAEKGREDTAPAAGRRSVLDRALSGELRVLAMSRAHYDISSALDIAQEFDFPVTIVGGLESYRVTEQLSRRSVPVILDPVTTGGMLGPGNTKLFWNIAGHLQEAGVPWALSGGRLLEQAQFAVRFGLPAEAALHAVTVAPAEMLGLAQRVGTLTEGRDADMVALSGEPLDSSAAIHWVMVNGKIYHKDNEP